MVPNRVCSLHHTPSDDVMTRWGRRYALLTAAFALLATGCGSRPDESSAAAGESARGSISSEEIRAVLDAQVAAWNRGSVRGFMEGYARTDTLRFASGGSVYRGWNGTLERYRDAYADEELMGTLTFSQVDVWPLSEQHAVAFGRWALDRTEAHGDAGGLFTLVFEKGASGWNIVHDHTSASVSNQPQPLDSVDTTS